MSPIKNLDKKQLRRMLLAQRRSLEEKIWRQKSDRLVTCLQTLPIFIEAQTILAYFSFGREPDLSILFTNNKSWGFPRISGQSLIWHTWKPGDKLTINSYGIQEPSEKLPLINPSKVDLILVPAVACDYQGYRLGYGGGYYDRMLSQKEWLSIPTVGIIFDEAYLAKLPIEPWDKRLNNICTESRYISIIT